MSNNKIIYHINCNYGKELLALLSGAVLLPEYDVQMCDSIVRDFVIDKYGEHAVNCEAIGVQLMIHTSKDQPFLVYDNLYTFVVLSGIAIPYQEWVYDEHYICQVNCKAYKYDPQTGLCTTEDFEAPLPKWADDKIDDLEEKLYALRDQLRYENRERERMDQRFAHDRDHIINGTNPNEDIEDYPMKHKQKQREVDPEPQDDPSPSLAKELSQFAAAKMIDDDDEMPIDEK